MKFKKRKESEWAEVDGDCDAEKSHSRKDDPQPEFGCPAKPFGIADDGEAEADEQDGVGGVGEVVKFAYSGCP